MLLRQFKGTGPGTIFLIIVTLLAVWASAFIKLQSHFSLYFDLDPMPLYGILSYLIGTNPLPGIIFTLALVSLMAFLMVNLNTTIFFINERTFLPALIYILLSGLFPQYQLLNPAIFAAVFLTLAIRRIMDAYRIPGTAYSFFDAGILIGVGSLFYANLIWFGLVVIIGVALLRTGSIKEIAISVIGLITPYFLTFGIYYVLGKDLKNLLSILEYNLLGNPNGYAFTRLTVVAVTFAGLSTLVSIVYLLKLMNMKKIKSRKTFSLLLWVFLIAMEVYFMVPSVSVEMVWLAGIPVSYFWAHYFVFIKKKLVPEIFFSLFFVFILLIQILYLK
ncbi:MAG: DUF6427 family protein [Bacteroidales bacterium]|jgi:hypothetical protein